MAKGHKYMAWYKTTAGRIYLVLCTGVTAGFLTRDIQRWLSPHPAPITQPKSNGFYMPHIPSVVLPPHGTLDSIALLPIIKVRSNASAKVSPKMRIRIPCFFRQSKEGTYEAFTANGLPNFEDALHKYRPPKPRNMSQQGTQPLYCVAIASDIIGSTANHSLDVGTYFNNALYHPIFSRMGFRSRYVTPSEEKSATIRCVVPRLDTARVVARIALDKSISSVRNSGFRLEYRQLLNSWHVTLPEELSRRVRAQSAHVLFFGRTRSSDPWQRAMAFPAIVPSPSRNGATMLYSQDGPVELGADLMPIRRPIIEVAIVVVSDQRVEFTNVPFTVMKKSNGKQLIR